jgi:phasin
MDNNPKNKPEEQIRRTAERAAEQQKQALDQFATRTGDAAETMRECCSKAVKSAQDYQKRLIEIAQTNANRTFEFAQKLLSVKSPSEFVEVSSDHMRRQWEMAAEQTKQLAELTQNLTASTAEPLKAGFERAFKSAA